MWPKAMAIWRATGGGGFSSETSTTTRSLPVLESCLIWSPNVILVSRNPRAMLHVVEPQRSALGHSATFGSGTYDPEGALGLPPVLGGYWAAIWPPCGTSRALSAPPSTHIDERGTPEPWSAFADGSVGCGNKALPARGCSWVIVAMVLDRTRPLEARLWDRHLRSRARLPQWNVLEA